MNHTARQWSASRQLWHVFSGEQSAYIFMAGREALNHRLELLIEDRQIFRMRLDSFVSLFQKLRGPTGRRHI